jgi:hypothetical protein
LKRAFLRTPEAAREGLKVVAAKLKEHAVTTGAAKLVIDFVSVEPYLAQTSTDAVLA